MKLLLAISMLAFLNIPAPAVGINPALMATRLFAEEKRSGYKQLYFKKAQHRRLEDTGGDTSTKASLPPMEEGDGLDDVNDGDYYYDYDFSPPPLSSSCLLSLQLTQGLMMQDERMNDLFLAEDQAMYMEVYDSICNSAGGQTLTMNFETSAECNQPSTLNVPGCLGAICDEEDIEVFAVYVGEHFQGPTDESCSIETSVVSDGEGDPSQFPDIPGGCVDGMNDIFMSDIYEDFSDIVIDEDTGMFIGDPEALAVVTAQCLELGGHMTTISMDYYGGECDEYVDLTSVPFCVSNMCNEDEAQGFVTVFLSPSFLEECEGMKITLATSNMVTDEMKAPKMPKIAKTPKELKMPKVPKMPKELKMPNIPKAPKITKAPVA